VVGEIKYKDDSAQLELELGLSLAKSKHTLSTFIGLSCMIIGPNLRSYLLRVGHIFLLPLVPPFTLSNESSRTPISRCTELSFEARDKLSKRKLVPRTQSYLLAHWILAAGACPCVEPCVLF
jgi:hypothetical protein